MEITFNAFDSCLMVKIYTYSKYFAVVLWKGCVYLKFKVIGLALISQVSATTSRYRYLGYVEVEQGKASARIHYSPAGLWSMRQFAGTDREPFHGTEIPDRPSYLRFIQDIQAFLCLRMCRKASMRTQCCVFRS